MKPNKRAGGIVKESVDSNSVKANVLRVQALLGDATFKVAGATAIVAADAFAGLFAQTCPVACALKDEQRRYVFINNGFRDSFSVTAQTIIGNTDQCWLPADVAARLKSSETAALTCGDCQQVVEKISLSDGREADWLFTHFPCQDQHGSTLLGAIAFDITELMGTQAHLRGQSELLELILNNIGDPVVAVDANGKLLLFNPAAMRYGIGIVGQSQTKKGDKFGLFLPDGVTPYPKKGLPLARAVRGESVTDLEIFVRAPDSPGGTLLSARAEPIFDRHGTLKGGAAVFRDVTETKRTQEELRLTIRQLEEARDEAVHASELKSQFVANVSHELRTPMSGVLGMADLLLTMLKDGEEKELATYICESAQNLLTVLNELLDFSRLEAGTLELEKSRLLLRPIFDEVANSVQLSLARKDLRLSLKMGEGADQQFKGDRRRIMQVLQHIVQNAVKFTEKGSIEVTVAVEPLRDDMARCRFTVTDTGIGIAPSAEERMFAPFVQADGSSTRKYGGVGLGLSISKRMVKLMDGEIGVKSELGKGSTFWFTVPLDVFQSCENKKTN